MKSSMHLNASQQLVLTPQLQQTIRLLQLSTFDLQQEIQSQVESNPMLEASPNNEDDEQTVQNPKNMDDDTTDIQWSQLYTNQNKSNKFNEESYNYEHLQCTSYTLQDYLRWQLDLTPMTDVDYIIGSTIIEAIDDNGFLTCSPTDLHNTLNSKKHPLNLEEIEAVRHRIQHFDPIGCGATTLADILLIQLTQLPTETPLLDLAKKIVSENITLLGKHNYQQILKIYHIDKDVLDKVLHMIQHLNPNPGNRVSPSKLEQVMPDLNVRKSGHCWLVELNPNTLPHLSINNYYASLIQRTKNEVDHQFLKNNLQEARWFLKSVQNRQETLLKVASYIVDYQKEFLEFGDAAMKPLILNDVALALNMHESTISRVTTQKFIYTPRGLFELKYFFSSHLSTFIGGECSSTAIRAFIKKLITSENHKKPLSDSKITELINEQGINVARRTVAKYRETMGIVPSNERKYI